MFLDFLHPTDFVADQRRMYFVLIKSSWKRFKILTFSLKSNGNMKNVQQSFTIIKVKKSLELKLTQSVTTIIILIKKFSLRTTFSNLLLPAHRGCEQ